MVFTCAEDDEDGTNSSSSCFLTAQEVFLLSQPPGGLQVEAGFKAFTLHFNVHGLNPLPQQAVTFREPFGNVP